MELDKYRDPPWADFIHVCGHGWLGLRYRLRDYHATPGGPWGYGPSQGAIPILPREETTFESLQKQFASGLKLKASKSSNSAVFKLLLAEQRCRVGIVSSMPTKGYRIRRSIRLRVPHLFVREIDDTYVVEWLQPRVDQLTDLEFAFSARLFLEMFEAPEIQRHEFCAWDTGRKNKWDRRKLRRLSSRSIPPMELDEFQVRVTAYLAAKRELIEGGQIPLWRPKDEEAFL